MKEKYGDRENRYAFIFFKNVYETNLESVIIENK